VKQRALGRQGLTVAEIGYGSIGMLMAYCAPDAEGDSAPIKRADALGVTFFDSAELYGWARTRRPSARPSTTAATRS
jgi:aryl-alcohol dehydrogenase-like predicted oxidoreductase